MELLNHDVLIVGGGGAGLRAAIAIGEANADLSVGVVSKVYPMRSHTVSAEGGSAAVIKSNDSLDAHIYDTISGADWLADQDAVESFVNEAPAEMIQLEHWGCPWSRDADGSVAVRPFGGMKIERTWFAADKTGFHMLHTLFQTALKYNNITRYDEWFVTRLLTHDGRCQGVAALELRTGQIRPIAAKAVILCTGGGGRIFPFTTNAAIKSGDGMALAYRAGVALKDMEFVQYHPTGLPGTGILITEASRGEGGILLNKDGYRYLQDYDLGEPLDVSDPSHPRKRTMELGPRDRLSQAFMKEREKGLTLEGPYGDYVCLDLRHMGEKKIDKKIPFVRELCRNYVGIDPVHELVPVRPVVHYMMGGVHTNINGETPLAGLFAAGECACVSINGANRLGSNSLTELLVFGARAARAAVRFSARQDSVAVEEIQAQCQAEQQRIRDRFFQPKGGKETIAGLRAELTRTMESGAGIYRTEDSLRAACALIGQLKERFREVELADHSLTFNTELTAALELEFMIDASEAVAHSALMRTESRGSHQRTDYPQRDDERFLKHSLAYQTENDPRIEYLDVVVTRWPPAERKYGSPVDGKGGKGD
ncbi:MAG: fumarate reductase (quinol) flavoprotein subunit [Bryobacterales bacterium]|nr:fumarate reductase (quinol) flavoprotein subunit [Bryobacterales bacterium]MDE0296012.1 fumarate reductase (quinol) flavoprotein subunit [Bryobacterales bacterium]